MYDWPDGIVLLDYSSPRNEVRVCFLVVRLAAGASTMRILPQPAFITSMSTNGSVGHPYGRCYRCDSHENAVVLAVRLVGVLPVQCVPTSRSAFWSRYQRDCFSSLSIGG
jgi:hypothetical protein